MAEASLHSEQSQDAVAVREIVAYVALGIGFLGGIAFRWLNLQRWAIWWDEGFTVWASGLPVNRIIPFTRGDNQAPLYYLLQHYWDSLFGTSEFALRSLSALFGTLAMFVFYRLAKRILKDSLASALAVLLFAFSMKQIWYSREARTYEAASFFVLMALYALVRFLERRSAWAFVMIVLTSTLTLYLHNIMFFYLLAFDIVWLSYPGKKNWLRRIPEVFLANACMAVLYLPWAVTLVHQVSAVAGNLYWVTRPSLGSVAWTLTKLAGLEPGYLTTFSNKVFHLPMGVLGCVVTVGLLALCGALLTGGFWGVGEAERRKNLCLIVYCVLPVLLIFVLSQRMPLYLDRVFTPSSVVIPIILAFPLATQKGPKGRILYPALGVVMAGVAALSSYGFVQATERWAKGGEDWRDVTATLLTIPEPNRLVLFVPPAGEIFFDYYSRSFPATEMRVVRKGLQEDFYGRFPPPKSRVINEDDIHHLETILQAHQYSEVDVVLTHGVDPQGLVADFLSRQFVRQHELVTSGPGVQIIPFRAVLVP